MGLNDHNLTKWKRQNCVRRHTVWTLKGIRKLSILKQSLKIINHPWIWMAGLKNLLNNESNMAVKKNRIFTFAWNDVERMKNHWSNH